jgi:hypothetical protein
MVIIATLLIVILHFMVPTISLWWAVVPFVLMVLFYVFGFFFLTRLFK